LHSKGVIPAIGVPKTIDRDVQGTEETFGFQTAVHATKGFIQQVGKGARKMGRVLLVQAMGREAGWIALYAGHVAGADIILIREVPIEEEKLMKHIEEIYRKQGHVIICVAESYEVDGAKTQEHHQQDEFKNRKYGNVAAELEALIQERFRHLGKKEKAFRRFGTQVQIPGYKVRAGQPISYDIELASRMGHAAGTLTHERKFGLMTAVQRGEVVAVPLELASQGTRNVPPDLYDPVSMQRRDQTVIRIVDGCRVAVAAGVDHPSSLPPS
jgi:6-phosphofructokinase 1